MNPSKYMRADDRTLKAVTRNTTKWPPARPIPDWPGSKPGAKGYSTRRRN